MSCGNGSCGCCPKCGCRATCTCNQSLCFDEAMCDHSYNVSTVMATEIGKCGINCNWCATEGLFSTEAGSSTAYYG